ncbi:MAG: glycosyltransferase family 2 protein [Chlorobiaceae bacterium]|nr:glycosyltransferase family 2 protein [Chlorobiaceae bacterium]
MAKDVINGRSNGAYHDSGFGSKADNNYEKWIGLYDRNDYANMPEIENGPLLSIIMPVYNPQIGYLEQAIQSVVGQVYKNWELCIADDKSDKEACIKVIEGYAKKDDRIKYLLRSENGHISAASNSAISIATGQYIVLLDQDDCIHPMALYYVAKEILEYPESAIIYSDEDKIGVDGKRCGPYFKCAFNYDLFLSHNLISHLGVYSRKIVDEVGGFRIGLEGSQDYDLALRCIERIDEKQIRHIPRVLYHWRMHENSTSTNVRSKPYAYLAARRAIGDHLCNMGVSAKVEPAPEARGACRVRYLLKDKHPSIEIVVLTRDRADLLSMCIYSVLKKTRYDNYCITIVDNGSLEPGTFELFENLKHDDRINVVRRAEPFNFSKLNNYAVGRSKSDYVCLLNNDVEVIDGDWLTEMLSHAIQDKVGAVGARLWYPDDTLQHAGVILGIGGIANNAHHKLPKGYGGYFGRAVLQQSYSAVTGACLMVSRLLYEEVGGLNEDELGVAYNDVDFCLKILAKGYRNVWTPYAELYHHESASRGREIYPEEVDRLNNESLYMKKHWGKILKNDPAYSPNLTDRNMHFSYAWPPRTVN